MTVGEGSLAPPPAAALDALDAQRADVSPRFTSRVAALYDADCNMLWGVACGVVMRVLP